MLPFYFCIIHSPHFLPVVSGGWDLMRLSWLVQEPNWVFNLVFRCGISLSKLCVRNHSSSTADQIPGSRPPLWKKGTILGLTPFPPGQVTDDNSDYFPHSQTRRGVFSGSVSVVLLLIMEVGRFCELYPSDNGIYQSNRSGWALVSWVLFHMPCLYLSSSFSWLFSANYELLGNPFNSSLWVVINPYFYWLGTFLSKGFI